ncbi:MAG: SNF2-related protein, partial [Burkholderiaceae bacterium]
MPSDPPAGDVRTLDRSMGVDDARVHDALCVLHAPTGVQRLADLMMAAELRTERGTRFNPQEVRGHVDRLIESGHAHRDPQGRLRPTAPHAQARFRSLMRDPAAARAWFDAWRRLVSFDRAYSLGFQEEEQLAAAIALVVFGGAERVLFERLLELVSGTYLFRSALPRALLAPFDVHLFARLPPDLGNEVALHLLDAPSGFAESELRAFEGWLAARDPATLDVSLRGRLAESALFAGDRVAFERLLDGLQGASIEALRGAFEIAGGQWESGCGRFEAALKQLAASSGRRKNLAPPWIAWVYAMGLLAQATPSAWTRARKFVAAEGGKSDTSGFWRVWEEAIAQRLGDARRDPERFVLARRAHAGLLSLGYLHHLLLAAWLHLDVKTPLHAPEHAQQLAETFEHAGLRWLALLARRAAATLFDAPVLPADAAQPFFIGAPQDSWREALASIVALGGEAALRPPGAAPGLQDRLIWIVAARADGRLERIEPIEQKAGVRGLGKAKPVGLAALLRRKDLPAHDAALLRAVQREDHCNRPVLDLAGAAAALVRHPCVAWADAPTRFVEVVESLPALEVMTQGEHIAFALLDPVHSPSQRADEAGDDELPARWQAARQRLRNVLLLPDGDARARLIRLTPAQLRVAELVSQGWKVPVAARAELEAALRVLTAHFQVESDAQAGHEVEASSLLRAELTPQRSGLDLALRVAPFGDFGPRLAPGSGRERVTTVHQGVTLSTRRDLAAERAAAQALVETVEPLASEPGPDWRIDDPEQALAVVEGLSQLTDRIVTEWPKGEPIRVRAAPDGAVTLVARSTPKGEWLEVDGGLALDGAQVLRLRELLALAQASRGRYIALGAGDFVALSDGLRQQLADLAALAQDHAHGQRLSGVAALAWEASGHGLALDGDAAWQARSQAWAQAQSQTADPPASLAAELRDYQLDGYRWLMRLASSGFGAVLADDMGLGKTVQTLALLLQRAAGGPSLVVAPTSVCGNWIAEATRFAPGLRIELYGDVLEGVDLADEPAPDAAPTDGSAPAAARRAARRRQLRGLGPGSLLVCSYALLQIDADLLAGVDWHSAVLDEAQAIKNPATHRARAALALRAGFRLALTGTPIENRLGELWSIMAWCNPG